jgi:hypothetical protein
MDRAGSKELKDRILNILLGKSLTDGMISGATFQSSGIREIILCRKKGPGLHWIHG